MIDFICERENALKHALYIKIKEALLSVLPVTLIVTALNLTPLLNLSSLELIVFLISSLCLIIGIGLFNLGADMAMTPMGEHAGAALTRGGNVKLLLGICFVMGLFITIAEPDLSVLAGQLNGVIGKWSLILSIGVGVGLFLVLAVLKILSKKQLSSMLMFFYMLLFALTAIVIVNEKMDLLPLAFDSGGVTTGPITVPFIMALGVGISATIGGKNAAENSFGLIALCSVGPMLAVMLLSAFSGGAITPPGTDGYAMGTLGTSAVLGTIAKVVEEVALALGLIILFFVILQIAVLKLPKKRLWQIAIGILYTFIGLVIFLAAVTMGFMPIGFKMGQNMAASIGQKIPAVLIVISFVLGLVTVLAEPAVHVLKKQVEEITGGTVSQRSMLIALSCGVGISIGLSMLRIVLDFNILYYLIPGYFISLGLSFFVPPLYTAIAFDSGGVSSGPLTSSFILPFAVGACSILQGEGLILSDAFGVVAMVAMTPLITIQILGFRAIMVHRMQEKIAMKRILSADDEQIIDFM